MEYLLFLFLLIPYFIGSIPFGLLLTKLFGYGDIRTIGSGNIGATNVMRTGNKKLAVLTLLLDFLKGYLPILISAKIDYALSPDNLYDCQRYYNAYFSYNTEPVVIPAPIFIISLSIGIPVILGHIFPIWLKFKGGKGVAPAIGVITAINPFLALCLAILWLGTFMVSRVSSLSALTAFTGTTLLCFTPFATVTASYCGTSNLYVGMLLTITLLLFFTHRQNISRLLNGTEHQWSKK